MERLQGVHLLVYLRHFLNRREAMISSTVELCSNHKILTSHTTDTGGVWLEWFSRAILSQPCDLRQLRLATLWLPQLVTSTE